MADDEDKHSVYMTPLATSSFRKYATIQSESSSSSQNDVQGSEMSEDTFSFSSQSQSFSSSSSSSSNDSDPFKKDCRDFIEEIHAESSGDFSVLSDKDILGIMRYLQPRDIAHIGETCHRLNRVKKNNQSINKQINKKIYT